MKNREFLTPKELAARWRLSEQTLSNWRFEKKGPEYIKIGSKVLYPLENVTLFEEKPAEEYFQ